MNEYMFFVRHPFFKHRHEIKALNIDEALNELRSCYPIKDERYQALLIITTAFENGSKVIAEQKLF